MPSYDQIVNMILTTGIVDIMSQKISARDGLTSMQRLTQAQLDEDLKALK